MTSLASFFAGSCTCARRSSDEKTDSVADAFRSEARVYWVRKSPVLDASARPVSAIGAPVLLEVMPDGRARSVPGAAERIDGYVPASILSAPKDDEGLALYVQRQTDLHQHSPDGPVIARAHPGAFLSVAPSGANHFWVALPAFRADFVGSEKQIVAVADADAFGTAPRPLQRPAPEGRLVEDFSPNGALWPTSSVEGSAPFAVTLCGDIHVLSEEERRSRISQHHAGVDLLGWFEFPIEFARGPIRCKLRVVFKNGATLMLTGAGSTAADRVPISAPPEGFVRADLTGGDAFADRLTRRLPVHWLTRAKSGTPTCTEWSFERVRKGTPPSAGFEGRMRRSPVVVNGERVVPTFDFKYQPADERRGGTLTLAGPHFSKPASSPSESGGAGGYRCGTEYSFVGTTGDALRMLSGPWSSNERLVAWHADDEEHWYVSSESCEAAARAASRAPPAESKTLPGGFHVDCYDELNE